jgi:4-nitrophenyl phosphatase
MDRPSWTGVRFVLCDLDGVVWLARQPIPGAVEAIERLRTAGRRVVFVTNNSMSVIADQEAALAAIGVPASGDVVTSAQAGASLVDPGQIVLVCGAEGLVEAVAARGATVVREGPADVVIVGLHHDFDYWRLHAANAAIRGGARFIATNDDPSFPTPSGQTPGAGALVAAVATASGVRPVVAGKPYEPMARLVAERCGPDFRPERALVVGDRPSTDGRFARTVGCPFAFVRSGVIPPGAAPDADVDAALDLADLATVADRLLGG